MTDMIEIVSKFEKMVYMLLMALLMFVLVASLIELVWYIYNSLINTPAFLLESHELVAVLGAFLLVLIGVELLDTIKAYFSENTIHVEIVVLLAIIAIARKVILLDPTSVSGSGFELMGIGIVVIGLAGGYYLIKKAGAPIRPADTEQK
jgi:uncharacterized membrane protein (DUF373 family)